MLRLKDPPCIEGLVGCSETTYVGSQSTGSRESVSSVSSSARSSSSSSRQASSASSTSSTSTVAAETVAQNTVASLADRVALYSVRVQNLGSQAVQGLSLVHGPIAYGATFNAALSDGLCALQGSEVSCSVDVPAGAVRVLTLAYDAGSAFRCTSSRAMSSVRTLIGGVQPSTVTASVSCDMDDRSHAEAQGTLSSSASSSLAVTKDAAFKETKVAYKPVEVLPQSGVSGQLFAALISDAQVRPVSHRGEEISALPWTIFFVCTVLIFAVFRAWLRRMA